MYFVKRKTFLGQQAQKFDEPIIIKRKFTQILSQTFKLASSKNEKIDGNIQ